MLKSVIVMPQSCDDRCLRSSLQIIGSALFEGVVSVSSPSPFSRLSPHLGAAHCKGAAISTAWQAA